MKKKSSPLPRKAVKIKRALKAPARAPSARPRAARGLAATSSGFDDVYHRIQDILAEARSQAWRAVNAAMVAVYWEIGRVIVEDEQHGKGRADYGTQLLANLGERLTHEFGKGFDRTNLHRMRLFYLAYPIRDALRHELAWSHYRTLLRLDDPRARTFYEAEAVASRWSTRELERQVNSLLFERLALSRDQDQVLTLARAGHEILQPSDLIKDPYVLEFVGLRQDVAFRESDLEQALIDKLQEFLLELGKGFAFMARQQRITLDGQHYFIDLVFYNRLTRCYVLIDLKVGELTHQDLGQMQMYVNYYARELTAPDENPPLGIVLCTDKSEAVVRYTLPEGNKTIFASRYKLHLPTEAELAAELKRERLDIELHQGLATSPTAPDSDQTPVKNSKRRK